MIPALPLYLAGRVGVFVAAAFVVAAAGTIYFCIQDKGKI